MKEFFDVYDKDLMNTKSPNHIGLDIGKCSIYKDKIKIELDNGVTLNQYDAIRFKNSNKGLIINFLPSTLIPIIMKIRFITPKEIPVGMWRVWYKIVPIPDTPPLTTLLGT